MHNNDILCYNMICYNLFLGILMPTLDFKGKQFIYRYHPTIPVRTLNIDKKKSLNKVMINH